MVKAPKLEVLTWTRTRPLTVAGVIQRVTLGIDSIMTARLNCLFGRRKYVSEETQPQSNPEPEGNWVLTDSAMTLPGKIPIIPEEDLPSLTWSTPKTTTRKNKKLKDPQGRTPFLFTKEEGEATPPAQRPEGQTRNMPPTKQTTRRDQPSRRTHHDWESSEDEEKNHKTQGGRLTEQRSVIQFRRWLKKGEIDFVAATKRATNEEKCTAVQEASSDQLPPRTKLPQKEEGPLGGDFAQLVDGLKTHSGNSLQHGPGADQSSTKYLPPGEDTRLPQEVLSPAGRKTEGAKTRRKDLLEKGFTVPTQSPSRRLRSSCGSQVAH